MTLLSQIPLMLSRNCDEYIFAVLLYVVLLKYRRGVKLDLIVTPTAVKYAFLAEVIRYYASPKLLCKINFQQFKPNPVSVRGIPLILCGLVNCGGPRQFITVLLQDGRSGYIVQRMFGQDWTPGAIPPRILLLSLFLWVFFGQAAITRSGYISLEISTLI